MNKNDQLQWQKEVLKEDQELTEILRRRKTVLSTKYKQVYRSRRLQRAVLKY